MRTCFTTEASYSDSRCAVTGVASNTAKMNLFSMASTRMINDERETVVDVADLPGGLQRRPRARPHFDGAHHVHGSVGTGIGGICAEHAAAIFQQHFTKVCALAAVQIVSDQMRGGWSGAAAIIEFAACRAVIQLTVVPQRQAQSG